MRRIEDDLAQVGYSMVGRSGVRVMPCAIHVVHMKKTRITGFLIWASKPKSMVW
jgi:hypothetical protein